MPFEIIRDDITRVSADAIVNTANPEPIVGAGTDSAIHRAAGPKLLKARKRIGAIPVGSSVKTPAFDLPAKYVLHTVSPAWIDGKHGEVALLERAYDAALTLADRLKCRSVAFPLLSSGSYGFPKDVALSAAIRAFTAFLLTHEMQIILVVFGNDSYSLARGLFGDLMTYIDDNYVGAAEKTEYDGCFEPTAYRRQANVFYGRPSVARRREEQLQPLASRKAQKDRDSAFGAGADENAEVFPNEKFCLEMRSPESLKERLRGVESTFSEHLIDLLNECGEKDSDVYRRAEVSRQLFHKIISKKEYQPTKSTAIQLALGLRLDLAETQKLLHKAGYALTRSSKADIVVQYFIEHGEYSIVAVNTALFDCGLPLLGAGTAS